MADSPSAHRVRHDVERVTEYDVHLLNEGTHSELYKKLGAHPMTAPDGVEGTFFAVWAPAAHDVGVIGDFNAWKVGAHSLRARGSSGVWTGFVTGVGEDALYKYHVAPGHGAPARQKADPLAFSAEVPPRTASKVTRLDYQWSDAAWMAERHERSSLGAPISVYEVHLGSWQRGPHGEFLGYREIAPRLAQYVGDLGFTHVELLPIMEHPFYGSWGYQCTGYFAPTSRYGSPQDLMFLIDTLHRSGLGVILDWVPSHFPTDAHGLGLFDGTHLYEHGDPREGFHPDWSSAIFNYGRHEVRSFLISSAVFWLDRYHVDGLRVDAVASMLYRDYSRKDGEWIPNRYGGRENLEAIDFLQQLNTTVYEQFPDVQTIAEESTAWPAVSRPVDVGGLGFGLKWDMGWMHDALVYFSKDPVHRQFHHNKMTFRMLYAFSENFMLPLSHDEVVHGKGSLLRKMPGDEWQAFANLRLLLGAMYGQAAKKLLFMGAEFGQWSEWDHEASLQWELADVPLHSGMRRWVTDLNAAYRHEPALHQLDADSSGLDWVDADDRANSVLSFLRRGQLGTRPVLVVANHTPISREGYRVGVPEGGRWHELLNSDSEAYGGSGIGNEGGVVADEVEWHSRPFSLELTLPPLGVLFLAPEDGRDTSPSQHGRR